MNIMKGECMCGSLHIEICAESEFSLICACTQCQKITGTGHAPAFAVPSDKVKIVGALKFYEQQADDGNIVSNGFCPNCGNPVLKKTMACPDRLYIHISAIDDSDWFVPETIVYSECAQIWDKNIISEEI